MSNLACKHTAGFTLPEILAVLAIVGILSSLAGPALTQSTQSIHAQSEATLLASAMTFARSEAMKRGSPVSMCVSSNGTSCLTTAAWNNGWIVFDDAASNQTVGAILKVQPPIKGFDTVSADYATSWFSFNHDGYASNLAAVNVTFTVHTSPSNSRATRCVALSRTGRIATQSTGTGACA